MFFQRKRSRRRKRRNRRKRSLQRRKRRTVGRSRKSRRKSQRKRNLERRRRVRRRRFPLPDRKLDSGHRARNFIPFLIIIIISYSFSSKLIHSCHGHSHHHYHHQSSIIESSCLINHQKMYLKYCN